MLHPLKVAQPFQAVPQLTRKFSMPVGTFYIQTIVLTPHHGLMAVLWHIFIQTLKIATIFTAAHIKKTTETDIEVQDEDQKSKTVNSLAITSTKTG